MDEPPHQLPSEKYRHFAFLTSPNATFSTEELVLMDKI